MTTPVGQKVQVGGGHNQQRRKLPQTIPLQQVTSAKATQELAKAGIVRQQSSQPKSEGKMPAPTLAGSTTLTPAQQKALAAYKSRHPQGQQKVPVGIRKSFI